MTVWKCIEMKKKKTQSLQRMIFKDLVVYHLFIFIYMFIYMLLRKGYPEHETKLSDSEGPILALWWMWNALLLSWVSFHL